MRGEAIPSLTLSVTRASNLSALGRRGARAPHASWGRALASPGGQATLGTQRTAGFVRSRHARHAARARVTTRRTYPHIEKRRSPAFGCRQEKAASLASVPALYRQKAPGGASRHQDKRVWASPSVASIPNQTHSYGACGMCVRRFGYRSVTRNSTALLKEWSGCLMQYGSSNPSMPSISVLPRISTVFGVSLFTAVR